MIVEHYPVPIHKQNIYKKQEKKFNYPVTEKIVKEIISLPIYPELNIKQIRFISDVINKNVFD